ncbi:MAG: radical SAM protein [Lentisphaerae bacterium]|nr:radical SAM protein [Lentisphaerota bacterium]
MASEPESLSGPNPFVRRMRLAQMPLWHRHTHATPLSLELELTARCNNNCRHCYNNLPANDSAAMRRELPADRIADIAGQAVKLGALWAGLTGGEPLLRKDFPEIYLNLHRRGLLISVMTNACLITPSIVRLFRKHPPREIEVSVYGVTQATYERITRRPGSYADFRRGLDLLLRHPFNLRLKTMALRSNAHELPDIARFCRARTSAAFRFDPHLHLRYDRDPKRNREIRQERLSAESVVRLEQADTERARALAKDCRRLTHGRPRLSDGTHLFRCNLGAQSFYVTHDGYFRLCPSLVHPNCILDLKQHSLQKAWTQFRPRVWSRQSRNPETRRCYACLQSNLCVGCPAHVYLESGRLDAVAGVFCRLAKARARAIQRHGNQRRIASS